ncbi:MAG: hypothetical protein FJ403_01545 [Verrucomicrobia bacterium]|nr:hypothetical protein [Verrucomicrobiota bacterium]
MLLPAWLITFNYGSKRYQVVANGCTGAIAGKHPLSWVKILFLILTIALGAAIGYLVFGR